MFVAKRTMRSGRGFDFGYGFPEIPIFKDPFLTLFLNPSLNSEDCPTL
jgi:hypothetical protein